MLNKNDCSHSLAKGTESWCNELKMYRKLLFFESCRDVNLYFKVEHLVFSNCLAYFKKVFLLTTGIVIYQEAARIPVIVCVIENFELDERCLACLHCRVILILRDSILLRNVLYVR